MVVGLLRAAPAGARGRVYAAGRRTDRRGRAARRHRIQDLPLRGLLLGPRAIRPLNEFLETLERFSSAVSGPVDEVPLGRGALLVAQAQYPGLDIDGYERRLQQLAEVLAPRLDGVSDAPARVKVANDLLFSELGFHGNDEQYEEVRKIVMNDVIGRRTGITITLAIVYGGVGQRAGLDVHGVGLPGHVVARIEQPAGEPLYIDVFRGGRLLSAGGCRRL